jgi:hypothetical protein
MSNLTINHSYSQFARYFQASKQIFFLIWIVFISCKFYQNQSYYLGRKKQVSVKPIQNKISESEEIVHFVR